MSNILDNTYQEKQKILNYIGKRNSFDFLETTDEEIQVGDFIQYNGNYLKNRGIFRSGITKCTKIMHDDSNLTRIYYDRIDNGESDWLRKQYFKKIKTEKIDNTLTEHDFIMSLVNVDRARSVYEIFPVYLLIKDQNNNDLIDIKYLNIEDQIRSASCYSGGLHPGFVKVFPIFNENIILKQILNKKNSYTDIIKNLIK